jgi:tRNA/tmRNA/rRNA uracil-C5-methylase (TrmA/RlmC/RlmD family)
LYCGVGLFAGALARDLGTGTPLHAVEGDRRSCGDARLNLADVPQVVIHQSDVARWLQRPPVDRADLVVLDPSRSGAGSQVMTAIAALRPRVIAYVACDPVVLARDLGTARSLGYDLRSLRVFDAFPMTHHMECLAVLEPAASG